MERHRHPRLSLDLLRGFRVAARHLSFTRAAAELCVTQPAISREIRTLEDQLGTPLFRRTNRALQLTQTGEELYRAVDEALAIIDAATQRAAGSGRTLAVTATVPFASFWLAPRLPQFTRLHPEINMRVAASNDVLDLDRERLDIAIRHIPLGADAPVGEKLIDYDIFPVCSPELVRDKAQPIRTVADLAQYVLLDLETVSNSRPWYDWQHWFDAMKIGPIRPAGLLRFSHYDQVVEAAIKGSGIAIGKRPHLTRQLREDLLVAPLGKESAARFGSFNIIVAGTAEHEAAQTFIAWLRSEVRRDEQAVRGSVRPANPVPALRSAAARNRAPRP